MTPLPAGHLRRSLIKTSVERDSFDRCRRERVSPPL